MNRYLTLSFNLLIILLTLCCKDRGGDHPIKELLDKELQSYSLRSEKKEMEQFKDPTELGMKGDWLIVSENYRVPESFPRIHLINRKNWTDYIPKGVQGYGPMEITDAAMIEEGQEEGSFWVYNMNRRLFAQFSLTDTSMLAIDQVKFSESMAMVHFICIATDSSYIATMWEGEYKLVEFHKDGRRIGEYGRYETVEGHEGLTNYQLTYLNGGWLKGNPKNGLFVRAAIRRDRLEIFDHAKKTFTIIDGPDKKIPPFRLVDAGDKVHMDISISEPFRYRDIAITDAYIFALYGGISHLEYMETGELAKTVYVLTHKGDPLAKINLDRSISGMVVCEKSNLLYGITTDEDPGIAVFELPMNF